MNLDRPAAVILAGGNANRLGGADKPLLEVGGAPILAGVIAALGADVSAIAISANGDPTRFAAFGLPVLPDGPFTGHGPLAGLLAGLEWAALIGARTLLTVPGDTPFIPTGLASALAPPPACAASNGRVHHLVALWPVECRDELRRMLSSPGSRAVVRFTEHIGTQALDFPVRGRDPFLNINTPEDLETARALTDKQGET